MKLITLDVLDLQAVEEALRTGIVVAVDLRAHAVSQAMSTNQPITLRESKSMTTGSTTKLLPCTGK